jgi:pyruvate dehydrogenase E1 component alpha subunit
MSASATVEPLPYSPGDLSSAIGPAWKETLGTAYRWMVLARTLDARMQALQRQGRVGFYGAATGQEAVNVAAGLASRPEDWVFPGLREQLIALVRGHSLVTYAHSLFADDRDPARGRQMPCHPTAREVNYVSMSSVVGTQISQAVGAAYALRRKKDSGVVLAFFGDGATSTNDFHAGLNFAAVFQLPVVFVCANNQWAISVPVERQTASKTLAEKAAEYGMPGRRVDGTDFVAVFRVLSAALENLRAGKGPSLLEFPVFRMTPHSSSDDPGRYQPSDWMARAQRLDPVARLERWMDEQSLLSPALRASIHEEAEDRVHAAVRAAEEAPPPSKESLTEDVYASEPSRAPGGTG